MTRAKLRRELAKLHRERPKVTRGEPTYFVRIGAVMALEWATEDGMLTPSRTIEIMRGIETIGTRRPAEGRGRRK
jgi:hypothetical protein